MIKQFALNEHDVEKNNQQEEVALGKTEDLYKITKSKFFSLMKNILEPHRRLICQEFKIDEIIVDNNPLSCTIDNGKLVDVVEFVL
jgi:hypothetical protein